MKKRAGSDGSGPLAVLVAACCTAQAAGITLASPRDYQVFQRQSMTHCEIRVAVDVSIVDEHGLKRRHLERHANQVAEFFRALSDQSPRSDASRAFRDRLLKCQDKLFTFIRHDNVPWNHNAAENAIEQFAYYREDRVSTMKVLDEFAAGPGDRLRT